MKTNLSLFILPVIIGLSNFAAAQNVTIPDANFKNYLLSVPAINTNSDGEIQVSEAAAFSGTINASYKSISDLTGIEAFTSLKGLNCGNNSLTSLNISYNTSLSLLDCGVNQLTTLNTANNTALTILGCNNNQITGLNLSTNTALSILVCGGNNLTGINSLSNTALTSISCENNNLSNLNVAGNTALTSITCSNNQLTGLYLLNNPNLKYLNCQNNQITALDVYTNPVLKEIRCYNNQLTYLNAQNGNNSNFTAFYAYNNPNLVCIQVDNATYMNTNWSSGKDPGTYYSTNCPAALGIPNLGNDKNYNIYPNPSTGVFMIRLNGEDKKTANLYDVNGKSVFSKNIVGTTAIDGNDLGNGIYTLVLRSDAGVSRQKIVIAK